MHGGNRRSQRFSSVGPTLSDNQIWTRFVVAIRGDGQTKWFTKHSPFGFVKNGRVHRGLDCGRLPMPQSWVRNLIKIMEEKDNLQAINGYSWTRQGETGLCLLCLGSQGSIMFKKILGGPHRRRTVSGQDIQGHLNHEYIDKLVVVQPFTDHPQPPHPEELWFYTCGTPVYLG